jgi:hypothetical protein
MSRQGTTRGRPLAALVLLLAAWVGLRVAYWEPVEEPGASFNMIAGLPSSGGSGDETDGGAPVANGPQSVPGMGHWPHEPPLAGYYGVPPGYGPPAYSRGAYAAWSYAAQSQPPMRFDRFPAAPDQAAQAAPFWWGPDSYSALQPAAPVPAPGPQRVPVRAAIAQQMMWMAAVSASPLAMERFSIGPRNGDAGPFRGGSAPGRRWSADSWLLLRKGGNAALASGIAPATYGASQFGAVLRYRLAPQSGHRPTAYLRTTAALNGSREKEAALGISARPVRGLPVAVAAEARANHRPGRREARPAVLAWTELPPFALPMGARGEFYAQAGYVGGKFATPFADGQLRVDRRVAQWGGAELRAGGGAWAGAQKGASRVDAGPTATMGVPLVSGASARVGFDYRFRLAGNAEPRSGPALTISAGF